MTLFLHFLSLSILICHSFALRLPLCDDGDRSSLLQFKRSFIFDEFSCDPSANYTKLDSWKLGDDCCSWDGVDCDGQTGHVIGLDLSSSCIYGSVNSSSPLFRLVHLTSLDLSYNNFNLSRIPGGIRSFTKLKHLDLSFANFSGQVPSGILELSELVSLNLVSNSYLILHNPSLKDVAETLTKLVDLRLIGVNISSHVPRSLSNLTSLTTLLLGESLLQGEFPPGIFLLPNLRRLGLGYNPDLSGYLPEFHVGIPIEMLRLDETNFSGQLPISIGNLRSLNFLSVSGCGFRGLIPSSIGNLTRLKALNLSQNYFSGKIPLSFQNLTQLVELRLNHNQLTGEIPSWLGNSTSLTNLVLSSNELQGPIPDSIFQLPNIQAIELGFNNLSGSLRFDSILQPKYLSVLILSMNHVSLLNSKYMNVTIPRLTFLGLSRCNLSEFPALLRWQHQLEALVLIDNNIKGYVPNWIFTLERLQFLRLGNNFLTSFEHSPSDILPWPNLRMLGLSSNKFEGPLPIPPPSILIYDVSLNKFSGDISPLFCNLTSLFVLDLSNNNLSGNLPPCLGTLGSSAVLLNIRNNSLSGKIPDNFTSGCALMLIDFSQNKVEGGVPRSLVNCSKLEILNLEGNEMNDVFPSWLGILPRLRILSLRSNKLHGVIGQPLSTFDFNRLQIIDLSDNNFRGKLPLEYFQNWVSMRSVGNDRLAYMQASIKFRSIGYTWVFEYPYFIRIVNKNTETAYNKIVDFFVVVDLSSNKFEGEIPEIIGTLRALQSLNLSNNILTDHIPSSLGDLEDLEALDLSLNELSGEIPAQLSVLTFLSVFNVSQNNLTGPVPRGNQFGTFQNDSFSANPGLCGHPLSQRCADTRTVPLPTSQDEDEDENSPFKFNWEIVLIVFVGFVSGLVIGVSSGWYIDTRKYECLAEKKFGRWLRS